MEHSASLGPALAGWGRLSMGGVDRRRVLVGSAAVLASLPSGIAATAADALGPPAVPGRIGAREVEQVRTSAAAVSSLSFAHGGDFAVRAGVGQLQWANELLAARYPDALRRDLYAAVSRLADACAFAAFDALDLDRAARLFDLATACATEADDADLLASALNDSAVLCIWAGNPRDGLAKVDRAMAEGPRLSPTARSMLHATTARAHGQMGDVGAAERSIGRADEAWADTEPDGGWLGFYGAGEHAGTTSDALYLAAVSTDVEPRGARGRLEAAIAEHGDAYQRSRVLTQLRLAVLVMRHGNPDEAAAIGTDAVANASAVRSGRVGSYFRTLHGVARTHAGRPAVDEMRSGLAEALLA